jgi:hypothetical protein
VALSDTARAIYDLLGHDGKAKNKATLRKALALEEAEFERGCDELRDARLVQGSGRLARLGSAAGVSPEAEQILAALPRDGSLIGNVRLRSRLELDNETYRHARQELLDANLVRLGRGRGGSLARSEAAAQAGAKTDSRLVTQERELYGPFVEWLRTSLSDQSLPFVHVGETATPRDRARSSGQWSRPDVTAVQVLSYAWLPDVVLEVSTYEIKRAADAQRLESVYEAAAHSRWAHRTSLVVEQSSETGSLQDAILDELGRFGVGLYVMWRRPDGEFEAREEIPPARRQPEPEALDELLEYFIVKVAKLVEPYKRAIGR